MRTIKLVLIGIVVLALVLGAAHLVANTNWPDLVKTMHGK